MRIINFSSPTRSQSFIITIIFLIVSLVTIRLIYTNNENSYQVSPPIIKELAKLPVDSKLTLKDFHKHESKDGKILWEVKAEQGEYYPDRMEAKLSNHSIMLTNYNNNPITLRSPQATVFFIGEDGLGSAVATGGVTIKDSNNLVLKSIQFNYDGEKELISTVSGVEIENKGLKITGKEFQFHTKSKLININHKVKSVFSKKNTN
jgi:LPS export ABC transporter protein LptC